MTDGNQIYYFVAPVLRTDEGLHQHRLPVPDSIADVLEARSVRRLVVTLNGLPCRRALQRRKNGERYLVLSRALMRELKVEHGDPVEIVLQPDPDPESVDLAEELVAVLDQDATASARFYGFTSGRQRSLAHYVSSAKRSETRIKRALDLAHKLRTYTLHSDQKTSS